MATQDNEVNLEQEIAASRERLTIVLQRIIRRPSISQSTIEQKLAEVLELIRPGWQQDEDLAETPRRWASALTYMTSGYDVKEADINKLVTLFTKTCRKTDESCRNLITFGGSFKTLCAHHILGFQGRYVVSYIPKNLRLGASKVQRVVNLVMRTLQSQEDLVHDIADLLEALLDPLGLAVWAGGQHQCMQVRGVEAETSWMETDLVRGEFLKNSLTRQDWNSILIRRGVR